MRQECCERVIEVGTEVGIHGRSGYRETQRERAAQDGRHQEIPRYKQDCIKHSCGLSQMYPRYASKGSSLVSIGGSGVGVGVATVAKVRVEPAQPECMAAAIVLSLHSSAAAAAAARNGPNATQSTASFQGHVHVHDRRTQTTTGLPHLSGLSTFQCCLDLSCAACTAVCVSWVVPIFSLSLSTPPVALNSFP